MPTVVTEVTPNSCLIQFAKAPIFGQVKTRLQPALGKAGCQQLHQALVTHQFVLQQNASIMKSQLWCSEPHNFFSQLCTDTEVTIHTQQGSDLGERMYHAFSHGLANYSQVILIGSDCPFIDQNYILDALCLLQNAPVVLGPALDGGYVLIGLSQVHQMLFQGIAWGTDQVITETRQRIKQLGWHWRELMPLADIDRPEDLKLLSEFAMLRKFLI